MTVFRVEVGVVEAKLGMNCQKIKINIFDTHFIDLPEVLMDSAATKVT